MLVCTGFAAQSATAPLAPHSFNRRDVGKQDVGIEILFCGVCHSDLHFARNEWRFTTYPCVPGHEIVGRVAEIGAEVANFKIGDHVGVGCMVDSCRKCPACKEGLEQYCEVGMVGAYGGTEPIIGGPTYGGYSNRIVVDQAYVLRIPAGMDLASAAPLLCAGITLYSPLRHWAAGPGKKVGIVGLGGLGHMGVKLAHAMGAHTVLFTTSASKVADGERLGASEVVLSTNADQMRKHASSFDLIIDTVAADHNLTPLFNLLKRDATLVQVGAPENPLSISVFPLLMKRRHFAGSAIGGSRDAGNVELLRGEEDQGGRRNHSDPEDQRGLRTHAEERRQISIFDRHVIFEIGRLIGV
jgi:alcohol dehydrogenase (NADP+)